VTTQLSVPVCVYLYHRYYDGDNEINEIWTWGIAVTLLVLWLATFSFLIVYVIVPEYRKTFWSFRTGFQKTQAFFLDNVGNDAKRLTLMGCNRMHWRAIEGDVKAWTHANWERWETEQPEWFTSNMKARIPDEFIPAAALVGLGGVFRPRHGSASLSVREATDLKMRLSIGGQVRVDADVGETVDLRRRSVGW
jgi:hypothetical protein